MSDLFVIKHNKLLKINAKINVI